MKSRKRKGAARYYDLLPLYTERNYFSSMPMLGEKFFFKFR